MHFEVPKAKTLKEFGGEYLMIVVSILTALALESLVEKAHHNHLANQAGERIQAELRLNVESVTQALSHNEKESSALKTVRAQMLADLRAHVDDQAFMARFEREWKQSVRMSLQSPSLRREAWEAAVANQAVTWLPPASLQKYATAYAAMRDMGSLLNGGAISFIDGPRMHDVFSDVEIGKGNPREIFHVVTQMMSAYGSYDGNLGELKRELEGGGAAP